MRAYFKIFYAFTFILLNFSAFSQENTTISIGGGVNSYEANTENFEFINSDLGLNLGVFIPVLRQKQFAFGFNFNVDYRTTTDEYNGLSQIIPIHPREGLSTSNLSNSVTQSLVQFGIGPQLNYRLSDKFWLSPIIQAGYFNFSQDEIIITQENQLRDQTFSTNIFSQDEVSQSDLFFRSALRLNFQITKQWSLWAEGSYFMANAITRQSTLIPLGEPDDNGEYDVFQVVEGDPNNRDFEVTDRETSLNAVGVNFGIAYSFGGKKGYDYLQSKKSGAQDDNSLRSNKRSDRTGINDNPLYEAENNTLENPIYDEDDELSSYNGGSDGDDAIDLNDDAIKTEKDYNSSRSNKPTSSTFTNVIKERKERRKPKQKLIGILPANNSNFENVSEIKNFTWELIGEKIPNPQYVIEVIKVGANQQPLRSYAAKTSKTSINAREVFKGSEPAEGQYKWKIIETKTGTISNAKFFSLSSCEIDLSITNEEIECIGYDGEDRIYQICFDSNYVSPSGDLTFANAGSGLSVYDQSFTSLNYTLVNPNTSLQNQNGASPSTVSYCFEVTVPASVTEIGFGLQGDDLDPSPIVCQPGASVMIDELPDCICDECEDIELSFDDYTIGMNGTNGNQFDINGNLNANVPIYGIEVQIQSYSYSANPSACTSGVSSIEESGMILKPGTTVNGSTSFQMANESISGSPNTNNNATKNITYTSTSALTDAIPINLTVGLPGPLPGFDPDCCEIEYSLCVKIKVIYDEENCKSCVFTHCFTFNNQ